MYGSARIVVDVDLFLINHWKFILLWIYILIGLRRHYGSALFRRPLHAKLYEMAQLQKFHCNFRHERLENFSLLSRIALKLRTISDSGFVNYCFFLFSLNHFLFFFFSLSLFSLTSPCTVLFWSCLVITPNSSIITFIWFSCCDDLLSGSFQMRHAAIEWTMYVWCLGRLAPFCCLKHPCEHSIYTLEIIAN